MIVIENFKDENEGYYFWMKSQIFYLITCNINHIL